MLINDSVTKCFTLKTITVRRGGGGDVVKMCEGQSLL